MRVLDLFCGKEGEDGLHGWSRAFAQRGHEVVTVDIDPAYHPTFAKDILDCGQVTFADLGPFDVVLASPPCDHFSVASIYRNWKEVGEDHLEPISPAAEKACEIVRHTLRLIDELKPRFWWLENPRAALRKMPFMRPYPRTTVSYCRYGLTMMKPTDIWGVWGSWTGRGCCRAGDPCHTAAPRGSHAPGTSQDPSKSAADRAVIPPLLSMEVCLSAEADLGDRRMPLPTIPAGVGTWSRSTREAARRPPPRRGRRARTLGAGPWP